MALWIALSLAAQPALPATTAAHDPAQRVRSSGRASVRIVRPYRLLVGEARAVPGSTRRETMIRNRAGDRQRAILVEFE